MARAIPVLPEVASIRVSPGLICPRNSARAIIDSAGRSLTEPAGLLPSSLSNRVLLVSPAMRCKRTRGVLPTQSAIVGYCKVMAYSQSRLRGAHHTGKGRRAISRKVWCLWLKGISRVYVGSPWLRWKTSSPIAAICPSISASKGLSSGSNDVGASSTCNACVIASTVDKAPGPGALRKR